MGLPRAVIPGRVYLVTRRCAERRFFLRPDAAMTESFVFCLAAAARRTGVQVIFSAVMSNHHHTGVIDPDGRLPEFLEYLHKFTAKCGNALRGRWEAFWAPEQTSCVELVGPGDVLDKMIYAITNPVKDGLVDRVHHWPGLDCLSAIKNATPIVARRPKQFFRENTHLPESETLFFMRPPGWTHLSHSEWCTLLSERVHDVEQSAAAERAKTGARVLGRKAILNQHWNDSPRSKEPRRQLAPRVAARNKWARIEALQRNRAFLVAYRVARSLFLHGESPIFPSGTYWLQRFACATCDAHTLS
jgi:putative transposase